ncbi:interleukin 21 receptor, tandem duplicate 1 [Hoplias malabaricus]|uniref:interleukin 21 receptor, tandem duplicate 1 n=1 Tax=Hoplias malabaricus TaxID=27720 RepID=UPI003461C3AC
MAAICQAIFLLVVCGLVQCMDSTCNVTCTTDYISSFNCSISVSEGPVSCDVEAECRDESESVNGRCVIRPPLHWCTIQQNGFYQLMSPDTTCTLKAKRSQSQESEYTSKIVELYAIVKPQQPLNLSLTRNDGNFNLSWDMVYELDGGLDDDLIYRVRLQPKDDLDEKLRKEFTINEDRRYQEITCDMVSPGKAYVASVQAAVSPRLFSSEWSEWSISSEWTCPQPDSFTEPNHYLLLLLLLLVLLFALLIFFGKQGWLKKMGVLQYIPNPQDFFKPLYHTYQGDFKKWVGPVLTFNSLDILEKSAPLQVLSEKQLAALPLQKELLQETNSGESSLRDWSLLSLVNPGSKFYFLGGSSLGTTHSSGHISMDTVTVSGQEGTMSEWTGESGRSRADPSFHRAGQRAPGVSDQEDVLELGGREGLEHRHLDNWQLEANDIDNIEEISLDSYSSNEHSDDGYPQMGLDLDTIDSGFLESDCSSPMNSECDTSEHPDAPLLGGGVGAHSNYVKQWVAIIPMSEE